MRSPAAMRLRLDGTGDADAVVGFFEARGRDLVEIVPLIALSEGADRRRVQRLLAEWQRENPTAADRVTRRRAVGGHPSSAAEALGPP